LRGQIRYTTDDNSGAVVDFSEAIRLSPAYAWAYRARGDAFARLGNRARADDDRAKVDQLVRHPAQPVPQGKALKVSAPPAVTPEADAWRGGGLPQSPRRTTENAGPGGPR